MAKKYSDDFKQQAVRLYLEQGNAQRIAADLGIGHSTLSAWTKRYRDELNPTVVQGAEEQRRLMKENARLKEELAILKKATAFFARDTLPQK